MDLILLRKEFKKEGIFSELWTHDGRVIADTLEHAYQSVTGGWLPKLRNGRFKCVRGMHRLHGMTEDFCTFEVTGVVGHNGILFHCGNFNRDSEGCVLLGESEVSGMMVTRSREAFAKFMSLQEGVDSFELTVSG